MIKLTDAVPADAMASLFGICHARPGSVLLDYWWRALIRIVRYSMVRGRCYGAASGGRDPPSGELFGGAACGVTRGWPTLGRRLSVRLRQR